MGNNLYATSLVLNNIWYGGQIRNQKADFEPRLFASKPKLTKKKPLTIAVEYSSKAKWSDGKPVTVKDLRATWQVFISPKFNVISRTGWEDVKSITGSAKKGVVIFKKQYADWEALISTGPYAAHVIAGQDMNQMFLNSIAISEWSVALRQLAEGHAALREVEQRLHGGPEDEARPCRVPLHPRNERALPGPEGR